MMDRRAFVCGAASAAFVSSRKVALVNAFLGLSHQGVLRLGGHLSNITPWEGVGQDDPKQQRGVRHGIEDYWEWPLVDPAVQQNKRGSITRKAISNLRGFLEGVHVGRVQLPGETAISELDGYSAGILQVG